MRDTPPLRSLLLLIPLTIVSFFVVFGLWDGLAPLLLPALRGNERLTALTGFGPVEILGVLGPAVLTIWIFKVNPRTVFPVGPVPLWRLLAIALATVGLGLVITYAQGWFAHLTGLTYPKEISELIRARTPWDWVLLVMGVALLPAMAEEAVTRGYIQATLVPRWGLGWGMLGTAAVFALLHLTPSGVPTYLLLGLWLSWVRQRTGSLRASVAAHTTNNLVAVLQANFVAESFWNASIAWMLPLGVALFVLVGWFALREPVNS